MSPDNIRNNSSQLESIKLSSIRLGFSVTQACPLKCKHCSVEGSPQMVHTSFTQQFTEKIISEMKDIALAGIKHIDFTGGEPTLVAGFVTRVASAAKRNDISTGIVTAAHWASTKKNARRIIEKFIDIDEWDISTDVYHLEFVPLQNIITAFEVLKDEFKKNPVIRVAYHEPFSREDVTLIIELDKLFGRNIGFQPIGPVGRAHGFTNIISATQENYDKSPCPTTGLLIQPEGFAVACCAPLSHEKYNHPLRMGNAFEEPVTELIRRWRTNALLQTIRLWGFKPVIDWLNENQLPTDYFLKDQACLICLSVMRDENARRLIQEKANLFLHKLSLAASLIKYLGEHWMEPVIMRDAEELIKTME